MADAEWQMTDRAGESMGGWLESGNGPRRFTAQRCEVSVVVRPQRLPSFSGEPQPLLVAARPWLQATTATRRHGREYDGRCGMTDDKARNTPSLSGAHSAQLE